MATQRQIQANRRNAQNSTGPRSVPGKAASRMNALKTGIHAESLVIPGEDRAALETLTAEYFDRHQPVTPEERFFVDAMVYADWLLRRLRKAEAQLWAYRAENLYDDNETTPLGQIAYNSDKEFNQLQRRLDAVERSFYRARKQLLSLQSERDAAEPASEEIGFVPQPAADTPPPQPETASVPLRVRLGIEYGSGSQPEDELPPAA